MSSCSVYGVARQGKQGKQGKQNSSPAQEQLASTKKFLNRAVLELALQRQLSLLLTGALFQKIKYTLNSERGLQWVE
ncbi:hypothetical protein [Nostoc sp.]|uniref:hypothetical protein n=1 Tax=Nostoc sp. TaxID=1180 RepID=UPI002FF3A8DC